MEKVGWKHREKLEEQRRNRVGSVLQHIWDAEVCIQRSHSDQHSQSRCPRSQQLQGLECQGAVVVAGNNREALTQARGSYFSSLSLPPTENLSRVD